MSSVPRLAAPAPMLFNVEAEAALLGAMLIDNSTVAVVAEAVESADFYEPIHRRIFERVHDLAAAGKVVTPLTLRPEFEADEAMQALGGVAYLARLTADAQGLLAPRQIAEQIRQLATERRALAAAERAIHECRTAGADRTAILSRLASELQEQCAARASRELHSLDLAELAGREPQPKTFVIPRIAPSGEVTLLTGAGAIGKSLLCQQLATAVAAGSQTLGMTLDRAPAIYLTCEDDAEQLHFRQAHICRALGLDMEKLAGWLYLISLRGEADNALGRFCEDGRLVPTPLYNRVSRLIRRTGAKVLFLDNIAHLFAGNENDRVQVTAFVNLLNRAAGENGIAVCLLGHPNKGGDTYSGSTAWLNAVRAQATMGRPEGDDVDPDLRVITVGKPNYARPGEALRCRWHEWAFVRDEDLPHEQRSQLDDVLRANSENSAFLRCLQACTDARRAVSHQKGSNYAPKIFAGMPEGRSFPVRAFEQAMERLIHLGQIELGAQLWQDVHRHWKQGIRAAQTCGTPPAATPCGDPRRPHAQSPINPCGDPRAATPLYTTYIPGGAVDGPPPCTSENEELRNGQ